MRQPINKELFTFSKSWTTRFYEVDLQGVVHHAEMVRYFEIGRVEYWKSLGIGYQDFLDSGLQYVVANVICNYLKPLHFDMEITVMVRVSKVSRTSMTYEYLILNDEAEPAVTGSTVLVCLKTETGRPNRFPPEYIKQITDFEKPDTVADTARRK